MADTQPLEPTDEEIDAVVQACRERGLREFDVFRAVLTKWGTPTVGESLIRQMRGALALPCDRWNAPQARIVREAIDAADAWLEGKPAGAFAYRSMTAAPPTQPSPQQEAQEPVAVVVPCYTPSGKRVALYSAKQDLPIGTKLYTAPQPSPAVQGDALSDAVRVPLDSLHADAAYLIGRLREGSMSYARVIEIIRERIDAAKAAIRARAAQEGKKP